MISCLSVKILVDVLFVLFVIVQITYLFGGEANVTAAGFTYSEYARRGFGELVAVGVLSLGLIMTLAAVARRESRRQTTTFNALSVSLVILVGVIAAAFVWAVRSGQFDDLEGPAHSILMDDDKQTDQQAVEDTEGDRKDQDSPG